MNYEWNIRYNKKADESIGKITAKNIVNNFFIDFPPIFDIDILTKK